MKQLGEYAVIQLRLSKVQYSKILQNYSGHADMNDYVDESGMSRNGTWATDIEIVAISSILNTPVFVHRKLTSGKKQWLKYTVDLYVQDLRFCLLIRPYI